MIEQLRADTAKAKDTVTKLSELARTFRDEVVTISKDSSLSDMGKSERIAALKQRAEADAYSLHQAATNHVAGIARSAPSWDVGAVTLRDELAAKDNAAALERVHLALILPRMTSAELGAVMQHAVGERTLWRAGAAKREAAHRMGNNDPAKDDLKTVLQQFEAAIPELAPDIPEARRLIGETERLRGWADDALTTITRFKV